jgi:hypothetical protein
LLARVQARSRYAALPTCRITQRCARPGARVRLDTGFTPLVPQTAKLAIWESGALLLARPTAQPADTARRPPCATQRRSALAPFTAPPSERKLPHPAVRSGSTCSLWNASARHQRVAASAHPNGMLCAANVHARATAGVIPSGGSLPRPRFGFIRAAVSLKRSCAYVTASLDAVRETHLRPISLAFGRRLTCGGSFSTAIRSVPEDR